MAAQRTSFAKLQRERAKKAKAAAKRDRRENGREESDVDVVDEDISVSNFGPDLSPADLLKLIEVIHKRFDDGEMTLEEFEEQKAELLSRLPID